MFANISRARHIVRTNNYSCTENGFLFVKYNNCEKTTQILLISKNTLYWLLISPKYNVVKILYCYDNLMNIWIFIIKVGTKTHNNGLFFHIPQSLQDNWYRSLVHLTLSTKVEMKTGKIMPQLSNLVLEFQNSLPTLWTN